MNCLTSAQMREWEKAAEASGISTRTLMENAGQRTAEFILKNYPRSQPVLAVCGKGSNAGDGFVCARFLFLAGRSVTVLLLTESSLLKGDAQTNFQKLKTLGVPLRMEMTGAEMTGFPFFVDALLGTGLTRDVSGVFRGTIESMNASGKPIVSIDIPSGLDADTGNVMGIAVKAAETLTLGAAKPGLFSGAGVSHSGRVTVVDIGLPPRGGF